MKSIFVFIFVCVLFASGCKTQIKPIPYNKSYTSLDFEVKYGTDENGRVIEYNLLRYYVNGRLVKTQWVDKEDEKIIYKTILEPISNDSTHKRN